jgi:adenosylhomocysteine nucleosidase
VSADRDLVVEEIQHLAERFGAVAGDWESGAIAWVAARHGIPCLILRGVTDLVGDYGGEAYAGNISHWHLATVQVMRSLIEQLPLWLDRWHTQRANHP